MVSFDERGSTNPYDNVRNASLIPSCYLERVAQTRTVSGGEPLRELAERLRTPLFAPDGAFGALSPVEQHQLKERRNEALALHQLGVVQAHADPPNVTPAAAHYQQALALADELGMRPLVAHCHLGLGRLYCQTGRAAQARVALSAAIDLYRAMGMTLWLPQAEAALAQMERSEGR